MLGKIPSPYFFAFFSLLLVLSFWAGYQICKDTDPCSPLGLIFAKLGLFGFMLIPLGALIQLAMAGIQNLRGQALYKHNAISGAISLVLTVVLIAMAVNIRPS